MFLLIEARILAGFYKRSSLVYNSWNDHKFKHKKLMSDNNRINFSPEYIRLREFQL